MTIERQHQTGAEYPELVKEATRELNMEANSENNDMDTSGVSCGGENKSVDSASEPMGTELNEYNGAGQIGCDTGDDSGEELTGEDVVQDCDNNDNNCLALCGKILRLMGDEQLCKSCGRYLRSLGDEIYYKQCMKNLLKDMLDQEVPVGVD